jgi:hypothetical protein
MVIPDQTGFQTKPNYFMWNEPSSGPFQVETNKP